MDHRAEIQQLVDNYPKLFSQLIRKNEKLFKAVDGNKFPDTPVSELVYRYLNPNTDTTCKYGNTKKFKSLTDGYGNCGRPSVCECAKNQVSKSVKNSKSAVTPDEQSIINQKRSQTNLKRYGVSNTAQTAYAKQQHKNVYADHTKSSIITSKVKQTKKDRYGTENYNNSEKIKETWHKQKQQIMLDRYPDKELHKIYDQATLKEMFKKHTPYEIAQITNTNATTVFRYLAIHGLRSPYKSTLEQEMILFLNSIGITEIISNSRSVLKSGRELDIFLPDYNFAIEMNGIYWHHEGIPHINKHYHRQKFLECEQQNIQLFTVFSDDWEQKTNIVKNMIQYRLAKSAKRLSARQLGVKQISSKETKDFLNNYHIQGYAPTSKCYALVDSNDCIQCVMTFSKPRSGIGKNRKNTWELVRYASAHSVRGGASKLLSHFIKSNPEVSTVVSYSNNEYSQGKLYSTLGFHLESDLLPSYFYYSPTLHKRYHRYNFAKHKLVEQGFDSSMTESEIQAQRGYLKVWDTGKRTWILSITN